MIVDRIENLGRYALMIEGCAELVGFLQEHDLRTLPAGRYTPQGTQITLSLFEYDTKIAGQTRWETHHTHMDIHVVVEGCEEVAWIPAQHVAQSTEYVTERDVEFFADAVCGSHVLIEPGYFCLVMPEDAHKPALAPADQVSHGKKAVIKVAVR